MIKQVITFVFLTSSFLSSDVFGQCVQMKCGCRIVPIFRMCQVSQFTPQTIYHSPPISCTSTLPQMTGSTLPQMTASIDPSFVSPVPFNNVSGSRILATNDSTSHDLLYRISNTGSGVIWVISDFNQRERISKGTSLDVVFSRQLKIQNYSGNPPMTGSYEYLDVVPKLRTRLRGQTVPDKTGLGNEKGTADLKTSDLETSPGP